MRNVLTIAGREFRLYFVSPIAYAVLAAFLVVNGFLFALILFSTREASLRDVFANMAVVFLFLSPALTMRLLAEEQRSGTIELLLAAPVRDSEVVLGKFLGCLGFLAVMLGATLYYPLQLFVFGRPDVGPLVTGYLGMLLTASAFMSIGLLASAFTQNQIVAAVVSLMALLLLWVLSAASSFVGPEVGGLLQYLGLSGHIESFQRGVIDSRDVVYFVSLIIACLFVSVRALESRRWA